MKYLWGFLIAIFIPTVCFAAPSDLKGFVDLALQIISIMTSIVGSLCLLVFFWGLVKFINHAGDSKAASDGKHIMFWGVIALFVMVSLWGIVSFIRMDLFGNSDVIIPTLKFPLF